MNGNCYSSDGVNPTLTTNKGEGNKIVIPVDGPEKVGNLFKSGGQAGNVYYSENVGPCLPGFGAGGGGKEAKVAIPVLTPDRANKRQNGRRFEEDGEEAFTLTSQDRHGVAVEVTGYNATLKSGGGHDEHGTCSECQRLQRSVREQPDDDDRNDVFAIDKGIKPEERTVANCIEARENRGLSKRKQEGTLICVKV